MEMNVILRIRSSSNPCLNRQNHLERDDRNHLSGSSRTNSVWQKIRKYLSKRMWIFFIGIYLKIGGRANVEHKLIQLRILLGVRNDEQSGHCTHGRALNLRSTWNLKSFKPIGQKDKLHTLSSSCFSYSCFTAFALTLVVQVDRKGSTSRSNRWRTAVGQRVASRATIK